MSRPPHVRRRTFLAGSAGALGFALLRPVNAFAAPASTASTATLIIVDPALDHSVDFGLAARNLGAASHPLSADRYRFVQTLLADATESPAIAGVSSFADFVMLTGALQDAGYRLSGHGIHRLATGEHEGHGEFIASTVALSRSRGAWPEALAHWLLADRTSVKFPTPRRAACPAGGTSVMSWSMKTRSIQNVS
jgi:hypothetical protein